MHRPAPSTVTSWPANVAAGLRGAWRLRRVAVWIWSAFLLLAALAALPTWRGYEAALSHTLESERLLDGLNVALLRELATNGGGPAPAVVLPTMMLAAALFALLMNPFLSGGLLTVLLPRATLVIGRPEDEAVAAAAVSAVGVRGLRAGFFQGGARHYWRLFGLLFTMIVIGLVVLGALGAALFGLGAAIEDPGQEQTSIIFTAVMMVLLAAVAGLLSMALDFARVAMVRDGRSMWRAIWTGLRMLFARPLAVVAYGLTFALLFAILAGLYLGISSSLSFRGWGAIWIGVALQQIFALARTSLRVAMVAGEIGMVPAPEPPPDTLPAPVIPPCEPESPTAAPSTPEPLSVRDPDPDPGDLPPLA